MHFWGRRPELHPDVRADDLKFLQPEQVGAIVARLRGLDDWPTHLDGSGRIKMSTLELGKAHLFVLFVRRLDNGGLGILHVGESPGPDPPEAAFKLAEARLDEKPTW